MTVLGWKFGRQNIEESLISKYKSLLTKIDSERNSVENEKKSESRTVIFTIVNK